MAWKFCTFVSRDAPVSVQKIVNGIFALSLPCVAISSLLWLRQSYGIVPLPSLHRLTPWAHIGIASTEVAIRISIACNKCSINGKKRESYSRQGNRIATNLIGTQTQCCGTCIVSQCGSTAHVTPKSTCVVGVWPYVWCDSNYRMHILMQPDAHTKAHSKLQS